jgi:hypothetical protein
MDEPGARAAPVVDGGQGAPDYAVRDLHETREVGVPAVRHADLGRCTTAVAQDVDLVTAVHLAGLALTAIARTGGSG